LKIENEIAEKASYKNSCEAKSYEYKRRVDEDLREFVNDEVRNNIIQTCD